MEKVSLELLGLAKLDLAWDYQLGWSGFEICFVKIDREQLSDPWSQNPWGKKCVGNEVGRDLTTLRPWL